MKNFLFQFFALIIVMLVVVFFSLNNLRGGNVAAFNLFGGTPKQESVQANAIRTSKQQFENAKKNNTDFSQSPCLSENMGNGYALDTVHDPRIESDTQNQCASFKSAQVSALVEILPDGTIVNIID